MVRDLLGNPLREGQKLYWTSNRLLCRVLRVDNGGLVDMESKKVTPGALVLEIVMPFEPKPEIVFGDLMRIVDPDEEARAAAIVGALGEEGKPNGKRIESNR